MDQIKDDFSWYHCEYCGQDVYGDPDEPCEGDCDWDCDLEDGIESD